MTAVPTVASLRRTRRRLDRLQLGADAVRGTMRRGAALHLQYCNGRALWFLSSGPFVTPEVAAILISDPHVVSVGDALFRDVPGQTWRWVE